MRTDSGSKGKRDSEKTIADKKSRPSISKSAEKKPRKPSDLQFTNIIEKISEGFASLDAQMNYLYVNQRGSELLERKPEELIGKNYWEVYPQDRDTALGKAFLQALETQTPIELENYFAPRQRWFEQRIYPSESGLSIFFTDITQRKQAEDALHDKDEQLRRVTEVTPILLSECSRDLRYLFVNRATADFLGFPSEEIVGKPIRQILGDKTFESISPYIERALNGERVEYELEIPYPAAGRRFMHVVYVPKTDEAGNVTGWLASITDMTERKQAEDRVSQAEERFRILSNTVPSMVWSTAPDGTIQHVNEHWHNYTGLTIEQSISNWEQLIHPDDLERVMIAWKHALDTVPDEYLMEVRYRRFDGKYRWFQSRAVPTRDESGNVTAWYGVTTDIHDRFEAENALRESEERTRLATQAARACTWELNIKDQSYRLGENFEEVLGFSPDVLPKNSDEVSALLNVPEDMNAIREAVMQAVQTHSEVPPLQYRVINPQTKELLWLEVNAKLEYDDEGRPDRMFGMVQNITGRKRREEALHAQEAELEQIINQTPFMLTRCTRDLRYQFVSRAYAEMIGRRPEQVAGKLIVEIMGEAGLKTISPYIEQVLQGKRVEYETEVSFQGVGTPALHVIYTPDYDDQGNVVGWFASIADVTARKMSENEKIQLLEREQAQRTRAEQAKAEAEQAKAQAEQELSERKMAEAALGAWVDSPLPQDARPWWLQYGMALVATAIAVLLRLILEPVLGESVQFTSVFGAIVFSVWYGGIGPALFSAILGYLGISWLLLDWQHLLDPTLGSLTSLGIFLFSGTIVVALGEAMQRAQRHAHQSARVAVEKKREAEFRLVEQKRVEEALRESERKFSIIYNNLPFPAALSRPQDGVLADVNQEFGKVFGYSKEEVIGKTSIELGINPETESRQRTLEALQQRGSVRNIETELVTKSEGKRVFLANQDVVDINGAKYILNIVQDITERKRAEDEILRLNTELQAQLDDMKALLEILPTGVWIGNSDCSVITGNPAAYQIMGLPANINASLTNPQPETPPGLRIFVNGDEVEPKDAPMQRVAQTGKPLSNIEHELLFPDGMRRPVYASVVPLFDSHGTVRRVIGAYTDFSERKRTEQRLFEFALQQTTLYKLADELNRASSLEAVFNAALDAILNALRCDRGSILLFDETELMHFVAWRGLSDEYRKATDGHSPWKPDQENPTPLCFNDINIANLTDALKTAITQEGIGSLAFIPLVFQGKLIGKFMMYFNAPHEFNADELDLSLTIAYQLASGIERKRAEEQLRRSAEFDAFRLALLDALRPINDPAEIQKEAMRIVGEHLQVDRVLYAEIDADDETTVITENYVNGVPKVIGRLPLSNFGMSSEILGAGRVLNISNITTAEDLPDSERASFAALGIVSTVGVPLLKGGRWVASLLVHHSLVRKWSKNDIAVLLETAEHIWTAIERASDQEALRASESLYRTIARSIPGGGVYVVDKDFRYVVADGPVTEAFGLSRKMLEGHTVAEVFPGERAERMEARLRLNFAGETLSYEITHAGRVYWTQQAPLLDSIGQAIIVTLDITERKQMEEALRQSEERFAQFMQHLPGLAWIKDVNGRYVYANAAAEKAFNVPREKLYGKTDTELFLSEFAAEFKKNDNKALMEAKGLQVVEMLKQEDGILHHSLVTKFPIPGPDGNIAMIGGIAFDITDRIQMEEQLQAAREQAEKSADRMARLQQVTASLVGTATPAQLAELILEQGTRATGAAASILVEVVNNGADVKTVAALGYPATAVRTEPVPLATPTPMSDCILAKQAIWLGSHEEFAANYPSLAESRRGFGYEAMVALPLMVGNHVLGGLAFSFIEKREFLPEEREFFLAVAQQCGQGFERARAAEALRASEERYRAIVNQATAGIVRKDAKGRVLFVNEAFCEMLGYAASDLIGKTMWQFTHEDDVLENRRLFNRLMVEGTPFQLEKRLLHRDGSILWATVSVSPVLGAAGKPESAVSVYAEITERKQAEVNLNESRERFRNLFNLVPVAVYTCDADGLIQEFNRRAVELWGREPFTNDPSERYCGSLKIFYPDGRFMPHKSCPMARMLRGEILDPSEFEIIVERRDGSRRSVIAHPLPLKNEHGKIVGAINCLYDITDRKQAESRLALLAEVSDLTRRFEDPVELMFAVSVAVGRHFQVRRCLFNESDLENDLEIVHRDYHDGIDSVAGTHKITDYSSTTASEITAGKTIVNHDSRIDPRTASDYERIYLQTGERAYVAVPLMRDDRWVASLRISDDTPHEWSEADVSLLETLAERTWTASEKLRIHAALRDSEERLRVTFNTTAVGFATLTPANYFVDVNEAFCNIVGYSREELLAMSSNALTHPAYLKGTQQQVARLLDGEVPSFVTEKLYIRKDNTEIWVQNSVSLVRDANGDPLHLIAICQDITERKEAEAALQLLNLELEQRVLMRTIELSNTNERLLAEIDERTTAEEALRESDATTRLILDTSPDAIVIANQEGRIMRVNAQIQNLFDYQPDEVVGKQIEMLIPERFHEIHVQHRSDYNEHRHRRPMGVGMELFGKRKDGSEFSVDVMLTPIQNQVISDWDTMVTIRDSTERKRMEAELRESQKRLQNLSQRLVEVQEDERRAIARELHDRVGQSLAALNLNLTIINNQLLSLVDEQINLRMFDSMQLVAEIIALVRDVMSNLRPAVLDDYGLEAALHTTLENFKSRYGITIHFEKNQSLIPRMNPSIEMTLLRIAQEALLNVVRHAQADEVILSLQLGKNEIILSIQDNGLGITSWQEVNRPGNHGLTIMRERAEAVGGNLQVSSTAGQGTQIDVSIPFQYEESKR